MSPEEDDEDEVKVEDDVGGTGNGEGSGDERGGEKEESKLSLLFCTKELVESPEVDEVCCTELNFGISAATYSRSLTST